MSAPATNRSQELSATFIDVMIRRFRGAQFFPVALAKDETPKRRPPSGFSGEACRLSELPFDHAGLYRSVQDRSYFLWKEAGEPSGKAEEFWRQSLGEHLTRRARAIWEREGRPSGKDHDHWYEACRDLERAGLL